MARKWLDIGVIGHKWTHQEYKKGRFLLVEINEESNFMSSIGIGCNQREL